MTDRDTLEIKEILECSADAEAKCRMISSVINGKPHYFKETKTEKEPKTVIYSGDGYADGYMVYDMAKCPSCGYEYEDGDKDWGENFCPHCGQPLKWENEG